MAPDGKRNDEGIGDDVDNGWFVNDDESPAPVPGEGNGDGNSEQRGTEHETAATAAATATVAPETITSAETANGSDSLEQLLGRARSILSKGEGTEEAVERIDFLVSQVRSTGPHASQSTQPSAYLGKIDLKNYYTGAQAFVLTRVAAWHESGRVPASLSERVQKYVDNRVIGRLYTMIIEDLQSIGKGLKTEITEFSKAVDLHSKENRDYNGKLALIRPEIDQLGPALEQLEKEKTGLERDYQMNLSRGNTQEADAAELRRNTVEEVITTMDDRYRHLCANEEELEAAMQENQAYLRELSHERAITHSDLTAIDTAVSRLQFEKRRVGILRNNRPSVQHGEKYRVATQGLVKDALALRGYLRGQAAQEAHFGDEGLGLRDIVSGETYLAGGQQAAGVHYDVERQRTREELSSRRMQRRNALAAQYVEQQAGPSVSAS